MAYPIEVTFADPVEVQLAPYYRHFRQIPGIDVKTGRLTDLSRPLTATSEPPFDVLLLPLPNCHGVIPSAGYLKELFSWLGPEFLFALQERIRDDALGELLPGSAIVLNTATLGSGATSNDYVISSKSADSVNKSSASLRDSASSSAMKNFRYIAVTCVARVFTPNGDSMAWLDPMYIQDDWAYSAFRGALVAIQKNCRPRSISANTPATSSSSILGASSKPGLSTSGLSVISNSSSDSNAIDLRSSSPVGQVLRILSADFHVVRSGAFDSNSLPPNSGDLTVKQLLLAWKRYTFDTTSPEARRPKTWADALLHQREVLNQQNSGGTVGTADTLSTLTPEEIENRTLYSAEELQLACQWVRDPVNQDRALSGAKLIANTFSSTDSLQFGLSRTDIARTITNKDTGCLARLLHFVMQGQIKLYVEIPPEDLQYGDEIGSGTAGSVVRATWRGKPVAVKKFKGVDLGDFLKELSIMSIVQHPNLVECYGGCVRNKDTMYIVQELMDCNVSDVLRLKAINLELGIRLRIAIEVAKGVSFLHTHCNLVHRDLKSLNLLATVAEHDFSVKVCDFGVSRVVDRRKTMTGNVGTVSWIAPEVFEQRKYTEKADVYSFGIVLWELLTRKVPFADIHSMSIPVAVIKGDRPAIPKDCPSNLKKLIRECWQPKASKRPTLLKVIEALQKILEQTPPQQRAQTTFNIAPLMLRKKTSTVPAFGRHQKTQQQLAASSSPTVTESPSSPLIDRPDTPSDSIEAASAPSRHKKPQPDAETTATSPSSPTPFDKSTLARTGSVADVASPPIATVSPLEAMADEADADSSPHTSNSHNLESDSPDWETADTTSVGSTLTTSSSTVNLRRALSNRAESSMSTATIQQPTRTVTCTVPDKWAPPISKLEIQVNKYFSKLRQDLDSGTIMVNNERYLLFRAKSLAVDFFNLVQTSFNFDNKEQSLEFAQNFLYDLGTAIGKADSEHFLASAGIDDPVARNNAGLVHVAYTGMAFVNLRPESVYSKHPEDECLLYEYTYSFESDSWAKKHEGVPFNPADGPPNPNEQHTEFCTCMMSAGYMSGWGEGANGFVRATAEISCKSKGDHSCLFVRSVPMKLEANVRKMSHGAADPLPRFLKNRSDTLPRSAMIKPDPNEQEDSWFQTGFRQLFKRMRKTHSNVDPVTASPGKSPTKFSAKAIQAAELTVEEIDLRASNALNSFFIDPTTATVEMADERCVLLRGDALARGFYTMVQELFGSDDQGQNETEAEKRMSRQFAWKFLYDLGKTIATSNHAWFAAKIGLPANAIERINALPVNMAYFGWCDLLIKSGHSHKDFAKNKENFTIVCEVSNSFEVASWGKGTGDNRCQVCYMHAGYLAGWIEAALKTPVVAVETSCGAQTGRPCIFTIAHSSYIKKAVASYPNTTIGLNTATATGVLPLLAKFKEKRRESTPLKVPFSGLSKAASSESGMTRNSSSSSGVNITVSSPGTPAKSPSTPTKASTGELPAATSTPPPHIGRTTKNFSVSSDGLKQQRAIDSSAKDVRSPETKPEVRSESPTPSPKPPAVSDSGAPKRAKRELSRSPSAAAKKDSIHDGEGAEYVPAKSSTPDAYLTDYEQRSKASTRISSRKSMIATDIEVMDPKREKERMKEKRKSRDPDMVEVAMPSTPVREPTPAPSKEPETETPPTSSTPEPTATPKSSRKDKTREKDKEKEKDKEPSTPKVRSKESNRALKHKSTPSTEGAGDEKEADKHSSSPKVRSKESNRSLKHKSQPIGDEGAESAKEDTPSKKKSRKSEEEREKEKTPKKDRK